MSALSATTQAFLDATTSFFTTGSGDLTNLQLQADKLLRSAVMRTAEREILIDAISRVTGQAEATLRARYQSAQYAAAPTASRRHVEQYSASTAAAAAASAASAAGDWKTPLPPRFATSGSVGSGVSHADGFPLYDPRDYDQYGAQYDEKGMPLGAEYDQKSSLYERSAAGSLSVPTASAASSAAPTGAYAAGLPRPIATEQTRSYPRQHTGPLELPPPIGRSAESSVVERGAAKAWELANRAFVAAKPVVKKLGLDALKFAKENPKKTLAYTGLIASGIYGLGWLLGGAVATTTCYLHHLTDEGMQRAQANVSPAEAQPNVLRMIPMPEGMGDAPPAVPARSQPVPTGAATRAAATATAATGDAGGMNPEALATMAAVLAAAPVRGAPRPSGSNIAPGFRVPLPSSQRTVPSPGAIADFNAQRAAAETAIAVRRSAALSAAATSPNS